MNTASSGISFLTESRPPNPGIDWRDNGRQLCIDTGVRPEVDEHGVQKNPTERSEARDTVDERMRGPERAKRGKVQHFSEASRRNLRRKVHSLRRDAKCLFVTLTYHETDPHPREAKKHLDRFWKALSYHHDGLAAIWKMEPQKRGTVHFHLMIYNTAWIRAGFVSRLWHTCTDETTTAHERSGVDVEWIDPNADGKVQAYLAKYMGKTVPEDGWENPGRWWGILSRSNLPVAEWSGHAELLYHEAAYLIRTLLDDWGVDTNGFLPPRLTVNTRGKPEPFVDRLLSLLP